MDHSEEQDVWCAWFLDECVDIGKDAGMQAGVWRRATSVEPAPGAIASVSFGSVVPLQNGGKRAAFSIHRSGTTSLEVRVRLEGQGWVECEGSLNFVASGESMKLALRLVSSGVEWVKGGQRC